MRNLQEQVKKTICYQKLFWPFTVWTNRFSDLKHFANSRPSASNFKKKSRSLEQFFLTVGHNNFGKKNTISNFSCRFLNHNYFWIIIVLDLRNLKEQVKKVFCYKIGNKIPDFLQHEKWDVVFRELVNEKLPNNQFS